MRFGRTFMMSSKQPAPSNCSPAPTPSTSTRLTRCCAARWNGNSRSWARLNRIRRDEAPILLRIRNQRDILVHGYDAIDDRIVWGVIEEDLDNLIQDAETLLQQAAR